MRSANPDFHRPKRTMQQVCDEKAANVNRRARAESAGEALAEAILFTNL
jgi:hypothetical protein